MLVRSLASIPVGLARFLDDTNVRAENVPTSVGNVLVLLIRMFVLKLRFETFFGGRDRGGTRTTRPPRIVGHLFITPKRSAFFG